MSEQRPLHRLFGLSWIDFFDGTSVEVKTELDLSLKQQFVDVVLIRTGPEPITRPLPDTAQGEAFIAFGRTSRGVPYHAPGGGLTDLFFLVCCTNSPVHLRVLARLSRLILRPGFVEELRAAAMASDVHRFIEEAEKELAGLER